MAIFLFILLLVAVAVLCSYVSTVRRVSKQIRQSIHDKRKHLTESNSGPLLRTGLLDLTHSVNDMIAENQEFLREKTSYSNHVEVTLSAIQEAVLIFDEENIIQFANESAVRLFQKNGRVLKDSRLEAVLRSTQLLELLEKYRNGGLCMMEPIQVEVSNNIMWFEVSCSALAAMSGSNTDISLLVLHNITELKKLEMVRRDFVANVSHELRTPITIIKGFSETLVEDVEQMNPETRSRFLKKILSNTERLHYLVEDLLTLSRLESKPETVALEKHSLNEIFAEIPEDFGSRLRVGEQRIVLDIDEELEPFLFDRFRVQQVLDNLIENVFRYAPDFTELSVCARLDATKEQVECCVGDDGPGIPKKDVPHIFERFYRVDKGRSRETGGTGLGLSISKHIVHLHGGSIRAESQVGEGTRICFTLPYRRERLPA